MSSYLAFYEILSYLLTFCIKDIWLTLIKFHVCSFQGTYRLIFYQSSETLNLHLKSLITGKTSYINSSSRLIRVSIGLIKSLLAPPCFRQGSLSNACVYIQQTLWSVVFFLIWRPPALPHRLQCSTIGRLCLNRRVRDGNGCFPQAHRHQKSRVLNEYKIYRRTNLVRTLFRGTWWEDTMCHRI